MAFTFKSFVEAIDYDAFPDVIIKKGEVLYHGTLESFDTRELKTGGYDDVFWTTDDLMIARTYIPSKGSSLMTSGSSILRDKDHENIRKSLGITDMIKKLAYDKQEEGYKKLAYWEKKREEFMNQSRTWEKQRFVDMPDSFFSQWKEADDNYKKAQKEWRTYESIMNAFVVRKMEKFGYKNTSGSTASPYFIKIATDKDGYLLPADYKDKGKVLKVTCKRDFRIYNSAYGRESDLTDVEYHNIGLFRKIEKKGYDGVIINDFAQSDYHGNYGHKSVGFFKSALKDLSVKQIKNQTHPYDKEWETET